METPFNFRNPRGTQKSQVEIRGKSKKKSPLNTSTLDREMYLLLVQDTKSDGRNPTGIPRESLSAEVKGEDEARKNRREVIPHCALGGTSTVLVFGAKGGRGTLRREKR